MKSTALDAKRKDYPPLVVQQLQQIEADLGGRAELVGLLTLAPLTPDLKYVLGLLGDPRNSAKSLAQICALGNVLPGELLTKMAAAALLRGKVQASQIIGNGIAGVTEDLMRRAAPYEGTCSACQGVGSITPEPTTNQPNPSPAPCDTCRGGGKLVYLPDLERQRLAIEMAQLLPKGGGLQILNQNVQAGAAGSGGGGALEKLQELTDRILYGQPSAVEGEVVDPDPPPSDEAST